MQYVVAWKNRKNNLVGSLDPTSQEHACAVADKLNAENGVIYIYKVFPFQPGNPESSRLTIEEVEVLFINSSWNK